MTPEEIQQTIEGMLAVQRDIQERQLRNTEAIESNSKAIEQLGERIDRVSQQQEINLQAIALLTDNISNFNIINQRHENRLTQLYGYQMSADTDRLNIMQNLNDIKRRLNNIESKLDAK